MQEKKSLFQNKLFQATLMVSIILISSAIFMSQTDKMFGKAEGMPITGHMVLFEAGPGGVSSLSHATGAGYISRTREVFLNTNNYNEILFIPGVDCQLYSKCCYSGRNFQSLVNNGLSNTAPYGSCIDATIDYTNKSQYEYAVSCTVPGALNHVSVSYKC